MGAKIIADGRGNELYDLSVQEYYQKEVFENSALKFLLPFRNLPFGALVYFPFLLLDVKTGFLLFVLISVVVLGILAGIFLRVFSRDYWAFLIMSLGYAPVFLTLSLGQFSIVLLLIISGILYCVHSKRYFYAGMFSSLLLLKFNYLLLLPLFMTTLDISAIRKFLKGLVPSLLLLMLMNFMISGRALLGYPEFLMTTESEAYGTFSGHIFSSESLTGKFFGEGVGFYIKIPLYLAFLGVLYLLRNKADTLNLWMASIYMFLFLSPHIQIQDLSITLLPMLYLFKRRKESANLFALVLIYVTTGIFWGKTVGLNPLLLLAAASYFLLLSSKINKSAREGFI
jgi:hypothetical protein